MAHLDDFIKGIIDGSIATEASHKDEINNLIKVIDTIPTEPKASLVR